MGCVSDCMLVCKVELNYMSENYSGDFSCSLCKLRLKFVQTTRVVCTDFAEC